MIAEKAIHILPKVQVFQRKIYLSAKADKKRKFGNLYDKVYRKDVLSSAWNSVQRNKGTAGIDDQTLKDIENYGVTKFLDEIHVELKEKKYRPTAVKRVYIPKTNGKKRPLGIPIVKDRVVQTAVKLVIEPIFEADFQSFSYGFRPKKNANQAIREIYKYLNFGCEWVIDADLQGYFDTIPHDKLILLVKERITDKFIIKLLQLWLKAGIMENNKVRNNLLGTPQGGVISPLLANIYLNALDRFWSNNQFGTDRKHDAHMVRYADDYVIICHHEPEKYDSYARRRLNQLDLVINEDKTRVVNASEGFDFLGYTIRKLKSKKTGKYKMYYYPSNKSMRTIKGKVKEVIRHGQHYNLPDVVERLNPILRGWGNYFKSGNSKERFKQIDSYVIYNLTIMLRKKHQKAGKGWREHPPSWYYDNHRLVSLRKMCTEIENESKRYKR
ncbi:group II intron reverse transcriptase/maturase [Enterococcus faecalis]|nr:group II intron reverse transcriptase/maturase [Enterococcus faecalis]